MSSYVPFTQEEIDRAAHTSIKSILEAKGEKVLRSGSEWMWEDNHSVKFRDYYFYDHNTGDKGTAIDFLCLFFDMRFQDAVTTLIHKDYGGAEFVRCAPSERKKKAFQLPPRNRTMYRMYAYLTQDRRIDPEIVTFFVHKHDLYESAQKHNAVFVGRDGNGKPRAAHEKGTLSDRPYRCDTPGSEKEYFFNYFGGSNRLYVFEAPIDLMSFLTLKKNTDWKRHSFLALGCTASRALIRFLLEHDNITDICLCLDNDAAGRKGDDQIATMLERLQDGKAEEIPPEVLKKLRRDYRVLVMKSQLKDWNEDLKAENQ
ncbi:DUF3991 and toprim domain-containing protein [Caproicibacter fermentans]|uniref:DUF3991 domain-containing protein n=1 Tax=Caproicibacter fermentans TaxID=2576756 RepID=A0A7G8TD79_9FIRM|nr:DUF3991 and toprim domain-containing protein [Caproicibacter fermentans]QNK41570.1 DUF3991 domain-containing protein [Caproicibacter fermentans]